MFPFICLPILGLQFVLESQFFDRLKKCWFSICVAFYLFLGQSNDFEIIYMLDQKLEVMFSVPYFSILIVYIYMMYMYCYHRKLYVTTIIIHINFNSIMFIIFFLLSIYFDSGYHIFIHLSNTRN